MSRRLDCVVVTFYFESSPIAHLVNFIREHSPDYRVIAEAPAGAAVA
jgi:hypothetical protein